MVQRRHWTSLTRGIVVTAREVRRADWALAGLSLAGPSSAISGWDAVRLQSLGTRHPPTEEVLILTRSGAHRRIGSVRIRPTRRVFDTWTVPPWDADLPDADIVTTARGIADTALQYQRFSDVRAMVTSAVQRRLVTPAELADELSCTPRNHSALLRLALADVLDNAHSIAEAEASEQLKRAPVPPFELNVPIVTLDGEVIAVADVLWRQLRAVLEVDSREFHFGEDEWKSTSQRHNRLTSCGLAVTHYAPSVIRSRSSGWTVEVASWLRARAIDLGVRYTPGGGVRRPDPTGPEPFIVSKSR